MNDEKEVREDGSPSKVYRSDGGAFVEITAGLQPATDQASRKVRTSGVIWGLCLIGFGAMFLLQRAGMIGFATLSSMWPLVFFAIAIGHVFDRRPGAAVMMLLLGAWFFAVQFEWRGLTYRNSWSLVLVAIGCSMVVKALTGEDRVRRGCGGVS